MPCEIFLERFAPRRQRQAADVLGAGAQQIEGEKRRRLPAIQHVDVALALDVDASLQPLEACRPALGIERDDFAVDEQRRPKRARQRLERPDHGGELRGLFVAEPRPEADVGPRLAGRDVDQRADAVVLRFEEQGLAGQRRLRQRRQHRADLRGIVSPGGHVHVDVTSPTSNAQLPRHSQGQLPSNARAERLGLVLGELGVRRWYVGFLELEFGSC